MSEHPSPPPPRWAGIVLMAVALTTIGSIVSLIGFMALHMAEVFVSGW